MRSTLLRAAHVSVRHDGRMGFNPFRQQQHRSSDYVMVAAALVIVLLLLAWALFA